MRSTSASLVCLRCGRAASRGLGFSGGQGRRRRPKADNRQVTLASEDGRTLLRLDEREGDGVAWWPDLVMADGTIEVDIRGKDVMQRSFVGVASTGWTRRPTTRSIFAHSISGRPTRLAARGLFSTLRIPTHTGTASRGTARCLRHAVLPSDPTQWFHARIVVASQHACACTEVTSLVAGSEAVEHQEDRLGRFVGGERLRRGIRGLESGAGSIALLALAPIRSGHDSRLARSTSSCARGEDWVYGTWLLP